MGEEQKHQKELEDLKTQIKSQFDHMQQLIEDDAEMEVSKHFVIYLLIGQMDYLMIHALILWRPRLGVHGH